MRAQNGFRFHIEQLSALFCLWILSACATRPAKEPTDGARAETLRRLRFDGTELQALATKHCAIILTGVQVQSTRADSNSIALTVSGPPNSELTWGLAACADREGYFLTAAHLIESYPVHLIFYDGRKMRAEPARVVAKLSDPEKEIEARLDLAIIRVDVSLAGNFRWAEAAEIHSDELAFEIGATGQLLSETNGTILPVCFAGKVEKILNLPGGGAIFETDLLTRNGDSGGPIFNRKGELLGIHTATRVSALTRRSLVNRPDLTWFHDAIAADRSAARKDTPRSPVAIDSSEPLHLTIDFFPPHAAPHLLAPRGGSQP